MLVLISPPAALYWLIACHRPGCIPNANGVASSSRGLARRRRGYPGNADERAATLNAIL